MSSLKNRQVKRETSTKISIKSADGAVSKIKDLVVCDNITPSKLDPLIDQIQSLPADNIFTQKLREKGMSEDQVAEWLIELCNWKTVRYDKNGNMTETVDGNLRLKAIEIWSKMTGNIGKEGGTTHQHLHLEKLPDDKLNELARKASKSRANKEESEV